VVVGFTAGAAILIATSQMKNVLGIHIGRGENFLHSWMEIFHRLGETKFHILTIAVLTLVSALAIKKSGVKNADQHENIMTVKLLEEIYADLKNDDKIKQIKEKLKESSNEEKFNQLYLNALVDECTKIQPLNNDELESLSNMRKTTITNYLLNEKSIDPARVKTLKNGNTDEHDEKWVKTKLQITVP